MGVLSSDPDPFGYWGELQAALDTRSTNLLRAAHASLAASIYDKTFPNALESLGGDLDTMDKAVLRMIEIANSIEDAEYRKDALDAAKAARAVHTAFVTVGNLWNRRFTVLTEMLQDLVRDNGKLGGTPLFKTRGETAKVITEEMDQAGSQSAAALQECKDAFSALKGKSKLTAYPLKEDEVQKDDGRR
jgi:hypothetical protein